MTALRIVVIGGGFSGAAFAIHLLRDHPALQAELTIIEPRARLGAGVAYGSTDPQHRINVAANRMALFAEDPTQFHRWLEEADEAARDPDAALPDGRLYPQRGRFGAYMAETLDALAREAAPRIAL
ncbi:FAD/NAD(P)-binding protein, partial [Endobacter medicaginis]